MVVVRKYQVCAAEPLGKTDGFFKCLATVVRMSSSALRCCGPTGMSGFKCALDLANKTMNHPEELRVGEAETLKIGADVLCCSTKPPP